VEGSKSLIGADSVKYTPEREGKNPFFMHKKGVVGFSICTVGGGTAMSALTVTLGF
jgi:hypothetical protein